MGLNPYEIRHQIYKSASRYHQNKFDHEKAAFDAGLIDQKPEFPTEKEIREMAEVMRRFAEGKS